MSFNFSKLTGGRDRDRTCDPYDVNVVLFAKSLKYRGD